jgi:hypothetical protein
MKSVSVDTAMRDIERSSVGPQLQSAFDRIADEVKEGVRHGFFNLRVTCEIGNGGKRHMVVHAGKSHKFTIPIHEIP